MLLAQAKEQAELEQERQEEERDVLTSDYGTEAKVGMKPVVHVHVYTCACTLYIQYIYYTCTCVHVQHYVVCMFWDKVSTL